MIGIGIDIEMWLYNIFLSLKYWRKKKGKKEEASKPKQWPPRLDI